MIGLTFIGISILEEHNPWDLRQVAPACCAAASGAAPLAAAARRPVTTPVPATAASASASVSRGLRSFLYPC